MTDRPAEYLVSLVRELCRLPHETEWVEFKQNNDDPEEIGEYISALSNSAALTGKASGYLVWGVDDATHQVVGTAFRLHTTRKGNQELENWLLRLLAPKIDFRFLDVSIDGKAVVLLEIQRAFRHPVRFQGNEFIRVGSYKKRLKDFPEKERTLWRIFDRIPFEEDFAAEHRSDDDVLRLLDYPGYFELLRRPLPENRGGILNALAADRLVRPSEARDWNITNLGAMSEERGGPATT